MLDMLAASLQANGLNYAIAVDSAVNADVLPGRGAQIAEWTKQPHSFQHQEWRIAPILNDDLTVCTPRP